MNRKVQIYIEGERIELFNDEQIQVTSTQQNINDISKAYTDFSQSFTVPASTHNNAIFQHFYQTDVNSSIDHNIRRNAFIEIDLTFFRRGKIQIEGSKLNKGKAESYTLTFYGEGTTLLDHFGQDLLQDLDYSTLNHEYTGAEVKARIEDNANTYDVKYPLISSQRVWTYSGQTPTNISPAYYTIPTNPVYDISTTTGHMHYNELFPAVRVSKIFEQIQTKYGINFTGNFLSDERFTKLFLWYKNKNQFEYWTEAQTIAFDTITSSTNAASDSIDLATNSIHVEYFAGMTNGSHRIIIDVNSISSPTGAVIDVYQNGNLYQSIPFSAVGTLPYIEFPNAIGLDSIYTFKIRTHTAVAVNVDITYGISGLIGGLLTVIVGQVTCFTNTMTVFTDLASMSPNMKIADFFGGIVKMFNMTCYGISENTYQVEPLDDWYSAGAIVDISEYTDVNSIDVDRMKLYKKITMKYQEPEAFLNKQFSQLFNRNYGDTTYQYNYDGDEFTLDVPFENILQNKFTGTDLQVGYSLNNEFAPYVPKPVLLYQYDNKDSDFHFNDGTSTSQILTYTPFGQDLYTNLTNYTLNFAPDISTMLNEPVQQTLFGTYYFSYLYNLYNLKQRIVRVKTILPISLLTGLQLNDRLIIRDKRYIINSMQSNLTTGEVNFELILDFRPMVNSTYQPYVDVAGGTIAVPIGFTNGTSTATISTTVADVIISPTTIDAPQYVDITLPANTAGTVYPIDVTYTKYTGITELTNINIIQK